MKKSELRQMIREEITTLFEAKTPKKGALVDLNFMNMEWEILFMDGSHIKMRKRDYSKAGGYDVYNIDQLRDRSYYKDLVKWMQNGDTTIENKKYK